MKLFFKKIISDYAPPSLKILFDRITASDIGRRISDGAFWSLIGSISAKLLVLLAGIITANILGKEDYGALGIVRTTINMFIVFSSMGMSLTAAKYIAEYRSNNPEKARDIYLLTNILAIISGIIISSLVFSFSSIIAEKSLHAPNLSTEIRYGALLLLFCSINSAQTGVLSGLEKFRSIALNTFVCGISELIFLSLGAYFYGIKGAILGLGGSYMILWVLNRIAIVRNLRIFGISPKPRTLKRDSWAILWKFSIPSLFSSLLVIPVLWYVKTLLIRTEGLGEMAVFDVAEQWRVIILFIPGAISNIILPILSNIDAHKDPTTYLKTLWINFFLNVGIALVTALCVIALSHFILSLYGPSYSDPWPMIILAFSTVFSAACGVVGQAIASKAKMWIGFGFNALWALLMILLSFYFLGKGKGAEGLALSLLISYIFHFILQMIYFWRLLKKKEDYLC